MSQNASKFNRDRVNSILEVGRQEVLCYVFACGTPNKSDATPLDQYLANLPPNSTANFPQVASKERKFDSTQLQQISRDPRCTTFDIALLFKAIKLACEKMADYNNSAWHTCSTDLEYYISAIKNERNNSMHGKREITTQEFLHTATRLRQLFHDALHATKERYTRSDAEIDSKIKEVNNALDKIKDEVLGEEDLLTYRGPQLKHDLIKETNDALKKHFNDSRNIDPMSFLTGIKLHLQIQKVFTEMKVTRGRVRGERHNLKYQDLVKTARSGPSPSLPQVLLVEGIAGSGKTTFVRLVTDEWLKDTNDRTITGLDYYDLLLRVQCRERKISSLNSLLKNEVPQVFLKFRNLVLPLIKNCKLLIVIDGLDESNEDSEKLIDDILTQMKSVNGCTLLFTSRPEGVTSFISRIPREYQISYIDLIGIPESHRELFVRRYHEQIKQQIGNTQDTGKLLENVRQVLEKEHFGLPLNMVFLTWIYIHDSSSITSTTTQTQLYHSTYQLCLQMLLDRLARHSTTHSTDRQTLETRLRQLMGQIQYESLLALWDSRLTFEAEAVESIKDSCTDQGIPQKELLSAFLTLKANRTHLGAIDEQYSAPHKGLQDFYAALHVANKLTTSASVRGALEEALGKLDKKLEPLQNVLYHVAGLLHLPTNTVLQTVTEEVVDMLHESGMDTREQWLNLVEDTRVNPVVVRRVAPYFANDRVTRNTMALLKDWEKEKVREKEEGQEKKVEQEEEDRKEMEDKKEEKKMEMGKKKDILKIEERWKNEEKWKKKTTEKRGREYISPVHVRDTHFESLIALLPCLPPCEVRIELNKEPGPRMGDLLNALDRHSCTTLYLGHHYRDPDPTNTSDQILQQVLQLPRTTLDKFKGHLTEDGIRRLPHSLSTLYLVLTDDDHVARTLTALHSVEYQLPYLVFLGIHVPLSIVTPLSFIRTLPGNSASHSIWWKPLRAGEIWPALPDAVEVTLVLSGINDQLINEACRVAEVLQCRRRYGDIVFPRASASYCGWRMLLKGLAESDVMVLGDVDVMGNFENNEMAAQLDTLARDELKCEFCVEPSIMSAHW